MQYNQFGGTGMEVSRYCLGAMTFGKKLDLDGSRRVVDEALDAGVNFIDTADSYGASEELLGKILSAEKRERVFLATKVYTRECRDGRVGRNSRVNIRDSIERSLRLLKTDYVDLYQLHHPDAMTPVEETLITLDGLVREGKVRYIGVSNHYAWQMAWMIGESKAMRCEPLISIQANYNVLDRQIEAETLPFCRRFNIALMCYGPLCGGILTGKYHRGNGAPKGSRGDGNSKMQAYIEDDRVTEIVRQLEEHASDRKLKPNQLATLWLLAKPEVSAVIVGGSRPEHFQELYKVADQRLPEEVVAAIDDISAARIYTRFVNQPVREGPKLAEQR